MVETSRLQAKRNQARCERSAHEPIPKANHPNLSYPRNRVSRCFLFQIFILDSCFRRNDAQSRTEIEVDSSRPFIWNPIAFQAREGSVLEFWNWLLEFIWSLGFDTWKFICSFVAFSARRASLHSSSNTNKLGKSQHRAQFPHREAKLSRPHSRSWSNSQESRWNRQQSP